MMAYANQYVASIILDNKPQREFNKDGARTVQVPFDSEYSIRVQNKTLSRASVDILIDGISIFSSNKTLIVSPGQTVNVERFVNDLKSGSRFKFVSLQKAISEGHQDPTSLDFGVISVVFTPQMAHSLLDGISVSLPNNLNFGQQWSSGVLRGGFLKCGLGQAPTSCSDFNLTKSTPSSFCSATMDSMELTPSSIGGTVEGSNSSQQFQESTEKIIWDHTKTTTIKIKLVGEVKDENPFPTNVQINNKTVFFQWMNHNPDGSISVQYK